MSRLRLRVGSGVALVGILGGALAGRAAHSAERRAAKREADQMLSDLAHDLRGPLTVIRGEVDLVLGRDGVDDEERGRSSAAVVDEVKRVEEILRCRREGREF